MERYDWADSHGSFKDLVGLASESLWVEKCNTCLGELLARLPPDSNVNTKKMMDYRYSRQWSNSC